jgi:hypothetical protein
MAVPSLAGGLGAGHERGLVDSTSRRFSLPRVCQNSRLVAPDRKTQHQNPPQSSLIAIPFLESSAIAAGDL